ncbi:MAG: hypothetical protein JO072_16480 [Parafilimonas sp.]|nr:hypothetical protein [Parafilimonas sp.]
MSFFKRFYKTSLTLAAISFTFLFYVNCSRQNNASEQHLLNKHGEMFAGSQVCASCHKNICNDFMHTAHFHTSSIPNEQNLKGSFEDGNNVFPYSYSTFIIMENLNNKFYQTEYHNGEKVQAEQFYLVIGSGTRGQSYLYLKDSQLYQLPVSYFTSTDSWSNSPGFPFYEPMFSRTILNRCLECHSTYADLSSISVQDKKGHAVNILYGIQCESCHGPAEKHVEFQEQHSGSKEAKFIINPAQLSRQQKIEMCAYCHSNGKLTNAEPFTYKPGDTLSKYLVINYANFDTANIDVHGNQVALLEASKCFKMSQMVCATCHNTHKQERGNAALFSQRCMSCHNEAHNTFCKLSSLPVAELKTNCIDCHMPVKQSKMLTVNLNETNIKTPAVIRSHFIAIYADETKKFIERNKQAKNN